MTDSGIFTYSSDLQSENTKLLIDVIESGIFTEVSAVFAKDLLPKYVIC